QRLVAARVRGLRLHARGEGLLVEDLGQPVTQGRVVHFTLERLFDAVAGKLQKRSAAELDAIAFIQDGVRDVLAIDEGAVGALQILDLHSPLPHEEPGVTAGHAVVVEHDGATGQPSDGRLRPQRVHLSDLRPGQYDERRRPRFGAVDERWAENR